MRHWGWVAVVVALSCAGMQQQWQAQQAVAQPANMEALCKTISSNYCTRCGVDQNSCGQIYISCLGPASPADNTIYNMGQLNQCAADVQAGDCNVMPQVWPASCTGPSQTAAAPTAPADQSAPADSPPPDSTADAPAPAAACGAGTVWDDSQQQCVAAQVQRQHNGERCRKALLDKGFAPDQMANCNGVSDRCALALINKGFGVDQLINCQGVDGKCAEQVIHKGFGPDQLINCKR